MPNKRISQLPNIEVPTNDVRFPLELSGVTYSIPLSGLTDFFSSNIDVLGQLLSGFTSGTTQSIDSGDTVLSAFEKVQAQIDGKFDDVPMVGKNGKVLFTDGNVASWNTKMAIRDTGDTADISYIEIDETTANINIVTTADSSTINITNNQDTIIISDSGLVLESIVSGKSATIQVDYGVGILFDSAGFNSDDDGVYITNPERIYFRVVNSGETVAFLSDLTGSTLTFREPVFDVDLSFGDYTISTPGIYEVSNGGGGGRYIFLPDPMLYNGQTITIVETDASFSTEFGFDANTPYLGGTSGQLFNIPSGAMIILKAINGKWRGININ